MMSATKGRSEEGSEGAASASKDTPGCELLTEAERRALLQLSGAMAKLPADLTAAYHDACCDAPDLVSRESNPMWFLRFHNFDSVAAARRLSSYWTKRKEIFQERFLLPLNLSKEGALTAVDIQVMKQGYVLNLPKDRKGRTVYFADISRKRPEITPSPRTIFFFGQCTFENVASREDSFVIIYSIVNPYAAEFIGQNMELSKYLHDHCFPLQESEKHIIYIPPVDGAPVDQSFVGTIFQLGSDRIGRHHPDGLFPYVASSKEDCLAHLMQYGLKPEGVPLSLGGTWCEGCMRWRDEDVEKAEDLEIDADLSCLLRNTLWVHKQATTRSPPAMQGSQAPAAGLEQAAQFDPSNMPMPKKRAAIPTSCNISGQQKLTSGSETSSARPSCASSTCKTSNRATARKELTEKEKERRRQQERVYGHRKREKQRIEIQGMCEERERLKTSNKALRGEGERLQELLDRAEREVEQNKQKCSQADEG